MAISFERSLELEGKRFTIEDEEEWKKIMMEILNHPGIKFDPDWEIMVIPPWGGAMGRFRIKCGGKEISVYLDWYSRLGWMFKDDEPIPYYEIYPSKDGDIERFYLDETEKMVDAIRESFAFGKWEDK